MTTAAPTTSSTPQPIAEYLYGVGVTGEQIPLDKLTDITVTLPRPKGWTKYANSNFSPGTEVIAKNNTYPTAMVIVFKLSGNFDVGEALKHAAVDAEMSQNFTKLNASDDDFDGFPSSMIEGSYNLNDKRLHSYNRVVIPVTRAPAFQRYLVQLTVTTLANQAAADAEDVEAIIAGFHVALK
ncbi:LpqN/LpqT family lipoprotein [Mycolicibacterium sp. CBM1]